MQSNPWGSPWVCPQNPWNQEIPKYHFLPLFSHPLSCITKTEKIQVLRIKWIGWNIFRRCLNALWICWLFLNYHGLDTYVWKCFDLIVTLWISPGNLDLVKTRTGLYVSICIFNTVIISWSSLLLLSLLSIRNCFNKIIHQTSSNSWLLFWDCVMTILLPLSILDTYWFNLVWYVFNDIPSEKPAWV